MGGPCFDTRSDLIAYASFGASTTLTGKERAMLWTSVAITIGAGVGAALVSRRKRARGASYGALAGLALGILPSIALWRTA